MRHVTPAERELLKEFGITNQWFKPRDHEFAMLDEIRRLRNRYMDPLVRSIR